MSQTFPRQYHKPQKQPRSFSEKMKKLRSPFLCDEKYVIPQHFFTNKEKLKLKSHKDKGSFKVLDGTKQDFEQIINQTDYSNTTDLDDDIEYSFNLKNDLEKDFKQQALISSTVEDIMKNDDEKVSFKTVLNKRLDLEDSTNETDTFSMSYNCSDDVGNKATYILDSDTSIENLSFSAPLKPLKSSTLIIQLEANKPDTYHRKANETYTFDDECNDNHIIKIDTSHFSNFTKNNSRYHTKSFQVPLITINEKKLTSKSFDNMKSKIAILAELEENKKFKAKLIQMELFKQIETKDKVMSHLLEVAQSSEFPGLKHFCFSECKKGNDGVCKQIKRLRNDAKLQEARYGALKYIWSTIKHPFTPVSPTNRVKVEGIARANSVTNAHMPQKNKKENSIKSEDNKHKMNEIEISWKNQKKTLNKSKPRKKFYLFHNGDKSRINVDKEENNSKVIHKRATKEILDGKLDKIKRMKHKTSKEASNKFDNYFYGN